MTLEADYQLYGEGEEEFRLFLWHLGNDEAIITDLVLPDVGTTKDAGEPLLAATLTTKVCHDDICEYESSTQTIYTPTKCEVLEVNLSIKEDPVLLHEEPFERRPWLVRCRILGDYEPSPSSQPPISASNDRAPAPMHTKSEAISLSLRPREILSPMASSSNAEANESLSAEPLDSLQGKNIVFWHDSTPDADVIFPAVKRYLEDKGVAAVGLAKQPGPATPPTEGNLQLVNSADAVVAGVAW